MRIYPTMRELASGPLPQGQYLSMGASSSHAYVFTDACEHRDPVKERHTDREAKQVTVCDCVGCNHVRTGAHTGPLATAARRITDVARKLSVGYDEGTGPLAKLTLDNLPAEYALSRVHEAHLLGDPTYWAYEDLTGDDEFEYFDWVAAVIPKMLDRVLGPRLRAGSPSALVDYLNRRRMSPLAPGPEDLAPGTSWLFHPDKVADWGFKSVRDSDPHRISTWTWRQNPPDVSAALLSIRSGTRLPGVSIGLIRTSDAHVFPHALIVETDSHDDEQTLQRIWDLAQTAHTPEQARGLAAGYRASFA